MQDSKAHSVWHSTVSARQPKYSAGRGNQQGVLQHLSISAMADTAYDMLYKAVSLNPSNADHPHLEQIRGAILPGDGDVALALHREGRAQVVGHRVGHDEEQADGGQAGVPGATEVLGVE